MSCSVNHLISFIQITISSLSNQSFCSSAIFFTSCFVNHLIFSFPSSKIIHNFFNSSIFSFSSSVKPSCIVYSFIRSVLVGSICSTSSSFTLFCVVVSVDPSISWFVSFSKMEYSFIISIARNTWFLSFAFSSSVSWL